MISPQKPTNATVKFLYSYGGRILPRPSDGLLRYVGGHTRVVSVDRSISFSELMAKLSEMCGHSVALRCQLSSEEMDVLVSVKSDEDLASVIDEYDRASSVAGKELKIRAVLSPTKPPMRSHNSSPSSSSSSSFADAPPTKSSDADHPRFCRSSSPSPIGSKADSRSRSSTVYARYNFDRHRNQFKPCHVQAQYRPLVLHSNYWQ